MAASDRYKDEFLSVVSHELRTPLNFILGSASILEDQLVGPLERQQLEFVGKIIAGSERMLRLVDNLVIAGRITAGKLVVVPQAVLYAAVIAQVAANLAGPAGERGVTIDVDNEIAGEVCVDAQVVRLVLLNLVDNAVKFSPPGKRVCVRAFVQGAEILTEVTDEGPGIPLEAQPTLFRRFHQLDMGATREAGGLGLGLGLSKALIEAHGGTIGVKSEPGKGSTFWFRLPWLDCR